MKKVTVIGTGAGENTLTPEARAALKDAEVLIGASGVLEQYNDDSKPAYPYYYSDDIARVIKSETAERYAVLVSGDVGFYSGAAGLREALEDCEVSYIPGVSTVNVFFAKLGFAWQYAAFVSMHGRNMNIADTVRRNRLTFCLAGSNVNEIGEILIGTGLKHVKVYVGENFGKPDESVYETNVENIAQGKYPSLTVLLFVNEIFDNTSRSGISDESFTRLPGIPMTKSETRALILAKLNLSPTDICWDVGAGTGSVTVEMAFSLYCGHVYAVERREDAIELIEKNRAAFHLGNITTVRGEAPAALESLPTPDAVFIGGSGGNIEGIISAVLHKNPKARIVLAAITLETISSALAALTKAGLEPEIVQQSISRGKKAGKSYLMEALNPVTIISA